MFLYNLKIAMRQLSGSLLYSLINICGLAIGLACCLLILLYVRHELSYESGFVNADRIYRVSREVYPMEGARLRIPASANAPFTPVLLADYPQLIEQAGRIYGGDTALATDDLSATEAEVRFADQAILQIFNFDWLAGDPNSALLEPNSVVLNETLARKYFGNEDALGKSIQGLDRFELKVTGVIRDLPPTTHISLTGLVSMNTITAAYGPAFVEQWNSLTDFYTYVLLRQGADIETLVQDIPDLITRHISAEIAAMSTLRVMKIQDIHLRSDRDEEWQPHGSSSRVYSFAAIAFSILLIACINFMSIATARASVRAREVGMRKTLGSTQRELIMQFLGEAMLFAVLAIALAVALVELLLPAFSRFSGMDLSFAYFGDISYLGSAVALAFFVAFFAGSYPAFYLSSFKPARVLKGEMNRGKQGLLFRNVLVVFQFSIAIALLVSTAVIYLQRELVQNMDLGFSKENIVVATSTAATGYQQDWPLFKQELLSDPSIAAVTASHFLPFGFNDNQSEVTVEGSSVSTRIQYMQVDYNFFQTYEVALLQGRDFSEEMDANAVQLESDNAQNSVRFILNASAARALGMNAEESINKKMSLSMNNVLQGSVIGVVADTLFESVRFDVRPLVFFLAPPQQEKRIHTYRNAAIKITANSQASALAHIDATWKKLYPDQAMSLHFLEDDFQAQYEAEEQQGQLFSYFALLAVLITCFGLFGLASFNAERRIKEIGVRKVMGGSVWSIVLLLTNDFSRLVLIANVVAWPLAYVGMERWLENFVYRIDLTPVIFIGSGLIALCIAWVTVGGTAAKAASQKPVLALRYE